MTQGRPESQKDQTSAPPPAPRPVLPLEYGHEQPSGSRTAFAARIAAGFIGYIFLSVGWVRLAVGARLGPVVVVGGWLAMTAGLLALALYLRRRGRSGYGYGILLVLLMAIGLTLLIIGLCWR